MEGFVGLQELLVGAVDILANAIGTQVHVYRRSQPGGIVDIHVVLALLISGGKQELDAVGIDQVLKQEFALLIGDRIDKVKKVVGGNQLQGSLRYRRLSANPTY